MFVNLTCNLLKGKFIFFNLEHIFNKYYVHLQVWCPLETPGKSFCPVVISVCIHIMGVNN